jgi:hypothetical protein
MSDGHIATMDTGELRQLINESIKKGMEDIPNTDQVQQMINNRLSAEVVRWGSEVDTKIDKAIDRQFTSAIDAMRDLTSQVAILVERVDNVIKDVSEVKAEQKRIDKEQDEIKHDIGEVKQNQIEERNQLIGLTEDVFGSNRKGTKSLVDIWQETIQNFTEKMDKGFSDLRDDNQKHLETTIAIETKVTTIEADVEANKAFREKRQKIEALALQVLPKAGQRLWQAATDDWVIKWATRIGLGGALGILAALLERLQ